MGGTHEEADRSRRPASPAPIERKVLSTGTFLHAFCPVCGSNMVQGDWIHFHAADDDGVEGELKLSPRFNVFDKQATMPMRAGDQMRDLRCPRCRVSLIDPVQACERCGAKTVKIKIAAVRLEIHLFICSRIGCRWHGITKEDRQRLILDQEP